ncbi:glycosyltransferase family 2 protein [Actinomarinicola tropica]|uniref:Glycosyltransferase n=1 Tax=Actinomarinicola tropica TaxID=2789776 RepID=A0A5Q2RP31_9ACTN|nr:glycosyltransferase family 2 protein [Actinomarinicola tropica]QGG95857.1 glycosyltransferase [Actinomarinicola tropica]
MKLIIQIPCLNEEEQLPATLADIPRDVPGFDVVELMVIDDGSTDRTVEVARAHGVHHIVKLPQNRGLAAAFQAGLDTALKLGADVVVNTDADNQYRGDSIPDLVAPIVAGDADVVVGDRDVRNIAEFSWLKRRLQVLGSWVVRVASGTDIPDATSGFRAYTREAALQLMVVSRYTYTIESIIQVGKSRLAVTHVPIRTNPKVRDSRLFSSTWGYVRRNALTILRVFAAYEPIKFFSTIAALLVVAALAAFSPFLWDWIVNGERSGHLQSVILGAILSISAFLVVVLAIVADLMAAHRAVTQRVLEHTRQLELAAGVPPLHYEPGATEPGPTISAD